MSSINNTKSKRIITVCLICLTAAVGILFAILGANKAMDFLGEVISFVWERFKGFVVGIFIVVPLWLLWWAISAIIDKVRSVRAKYAAENAKPVCPKCGAEVPEHSGRFCRTCGWDFTRPIAEAQAVNARPGMAQPDTVQAFTQPDPAQSAGSGESYMP